MAVVVAVAVGAVAWEVAEARTEGATGTVTRAAAITEAARTRL